MSTTIQLTLNAEPFGDYLRILKRKYGTTRLVALNTGLSQERVERFIRGELKTISEREADEAFSTETGYQLWDFYPERLEL